MGGGQSKSEGKPTQPPPALPPQPLSDKPWRKFEGNSWTEQKRLELMKKVANHKVLEAANVEFCNVLLVGDISAGKSSFINTLETQFHDHVKNRARAGTVGRSLTKQYRMYKFKSDEHQVKFQFCDTMGLEAEANRGMSEVTLDRILDGHLKHKAELEGEIKPNSEFYNQQPELKDKIHCLALVINAVSLSTLDEKMEDKFKEICERAGNKGLNPMVILTHIDEICKETEKDTCNAFRSKQVYEKVKEVADLFGITENMVFPVQNYHKEHEKELGIDILMLLTIQQILRNSESFFTDMVE